MKRIRLAIVDNDPEYTARLARFMSRAEGIEVVGTACDGVKALNLVRHTHPETLVTGLLLKRLDGISFLKNVVAMESRPVIITCSALNTDAVLRSASGMGVDYMMLKPVSMQKLLERVREVTFFHREAMRDADMALRVDGPLMTAPPRTAYEVLSEMRVRSKHSGYGYLVDALHRLERKPDLLRNVSKGLYLEIAQAAHTNPRNIEHSIRYAIHSAYGAQDDSQPCPSNRKFLEKALSLLLEKPESEET